MAVAGSTFGPALMMLMGRMFPPTNPQQPIEKWLTGIDIFAVAISLTALTAVLTIAIACVIVMVMKGPAYVADAYAPEEPDPHEP